MRVDAGSGDSVAGHAAAPRVLLGVAGGIAAYKACELLRRLRTRGTETDAQFTRRIETAREEMASRHEFDAVVVNDDLHTVVGRLVDLLVGPGSAVPAGAPPDHRSS